MPDENESNNQNQGAVLLERRDQIAVLTLSRPAALNALTWSMYSQMEEHLINLDTDETIRVIVIRGAGKAFAAGTDISQFQGFTGEAGVAYERTMESIVEHLYNISKPTIALISGYAVGAGLVVASVCDLRYATPASRFGAPIARTLGNCITLKNYQHLVDSFGPMRTKEMLFTARLLSSTEALESGFLTAIIDEEQIHSRVLDIAQQITTLAPLTIWATKEAQRRLSAAQAPIEFDDVVARIYSSTDFAEGVQAYLEKRKPGWHGR